MRYIFVTGGVMSSVGKGVSTASIGKILQSRGYKVALVKCDMYINIDAGTIRPTEHGEVFVGEDGIESDQDLGNYERFTGLTSTRDNYITTGQVYQTVINRERNLGYAGEDVEVVPDIPNEIIRRIQRAGKKNKADIVIVEIGGTVGEYQNILFLEAIRILKLKRPEDVSLILVSYLPIPKSIGEMKTKPTQYASRSLNSAGLQADFILCRAEKPVDAPRRKRLAIFCGIKESSAISAPDVDLIYEIPINFEREGLSDKLLSSLGLKPRRRDMKEWKELVSRIKRIRTPLKIGIVGKYFGTGNFTLADSYISVIEAIRHAAWSAGRKPEITWLNAESYEKDKKKLKELNEFDGVIVPGGFGNRGVEGKIRAIQHLREKEIPFLGLCLGMQLAVVEFARNVARIKDASTEELNKKTKNPVIHTMFDQVQKLKDKNYGATMRLGAYPAILDKDSISRRAYGKRKISERHRHRYEFNNKYRERFQKKGMRIAGVSPDDKLVEIIELAGHPFFVGTQFHPEFTSQPLNPNPLFLAFTEAAKKYKIKKAREEAKKKRKKK